MIMQTAFFKLSEVISFDDAVKYLKDAIKESYGKKGDKIVKMNNDAVDEAAKSLEKIEYNKEEWLNAEIKEIDIKKVHEIFETPEEEYMVNEIVETIAKQKGDELPVSAFISEERGDLPGPDGSFPTATTRFEKRGIAIKLPKWDDGKCVQCNQCSLVCPHAAIRPVLLTDEEVKNAPQSFTTIKAKGKGLEEYSYRMQLYPMDCTGCGNCVDVCPTNALSMLFFDEIVEDEATNNNYSKTIPVRDNLMSDKTIKGSQFKQPLFEFSGACAGCGETPYIKLATQLFGDRMIIANATGCSSIYGGTAPTIPFCKNAEGKGPAWANSLFEDNAEYGYGMALAVKQKTTRIAELMSKILETKELSEKVSNATKELFTEWLENKNNADKTKELAPKLEYSILNEQEEVEELYELEDLADYFVKKSVWIIGGDGWAYDIGYGGLDHVLASGENVNILVLDTEVYSNTGGQASKASQFGQVAKFAASGKKVSKKDLGLMAMSYGYVYVASVAMGANQNQVLKAMAEAEAYDGPSIIIAYSTCINHGTDMSKSQREMKIAVDSGYWSLYRYNPELKKEGKNPFILDSKEPKTDVQTLIDNEVRYTTLNKEFPAEAEKLQQHLRENIKERWERFKKMSEHGF
jgi:pyruvate-ferredoxin/flavodoxin oxidoreductase